MARTSHLGPGRALLLVIGATGMAMLSACGGGSGGGDPAASQTAAGSAPGSSASQGSPTGTSGSSSAASGAGTGSSAPSSGASSGSSPAPTESVSISPKRMALEAGQQISLTATTSDPSGVTWRSSPTGGVFSASSSLSGAAVTFTAPTAEGTYTLTAASVSNPADADSATVGVTSLSGVYTYHDDLARDGANTQEYALTPATVNTSSFGKLFSCPVDGAIYAQPLWMSNVKVNGTPHDVVFVATEHDDLYAFDADASPCEVLWSISLIDAAHGGTSGEAVVSSALVGFPGTPPGSGDIMPEIGVTGTPVIDPSTGTLYVVSKSVNAAGTDFYQRLHAIDVATGKEKPGSPATIEATYAGNGGSTDTFDARQENQRAGLALVNGTVYIAWASHEDKTPYYGWIIGYTYDGSGFEQSEVLNVAPDAGEAGIWMSAGAPAADSSGNLYVVTANGQFDATSATAPNDDYGDSLLQLSSNLKVLQYFTPSDQAEDESEDNDFGAGGATVLADLPASSPVTHLAIAGGKDGHLYVLNRDDLGGLGDAHALQEIAGGSEDLSNPNSGVIFSTGAYWNGYFYLIGAGEPLEAYRLDPTSAKLSLVGSASSPSGGFGYPGSSPTVSAGGASNGIVWALDTSAYCTSESTECGPAVLHAYDATNVAQELWNSSMVSGDAAGYAVKFVVPTVANGKVYVATRGNNTGAADGSTSISGELDVYGLKPN